jgi:hypothetical protein
MAMAAGSDRTLGGYFDTDRHDPCDAVAEPWHSMVDLLDQRDVLESRVDQVRNGLAAAGGLPIEAVAARIAASVAHLGLCARIVAPAVEAAATGE